MDDPIKPPAAPAPAPVPAAPAVPVVSPAIIEENGKKILKLEKALAVAERDSQVAKEAVSKLESEIGSLRQIPHPTKPGKSLWDEVEEFVWGKRG